MVYSNREAGGTYDCNRENNTTGYKIFGSVKRAQLIGQRPLLPCRVPHSSVYSTGPEIRTVKIGSRLSFIFSSPMLSSTGRYIELSIRSIPVLCF